MQPFLVLDDLLINWIFQPIGDWSNKKFGLHPQTIAEFFGMGGVFVEAAHQVFIRPVSTATVLDYIFGCLGVAVSIMWYLVICRPVSYNGGRNPKRFRFGPLRSIYFLFTMIDVAQLPLFGITWGYTTMVASSAFTWIGLSFASVDEPPAHRQAFSWAAS